MPTEDCFKTLGQLTGRMASLEHTVNVNLRDDIHVLHEKVNKLNSRLERASGVVSGIDMTLAKVGAVTLFLLSVVGFAIKYGVPWLFKSG